MRSGVINRLVEPRPGALYRPIAQLELLRGQAFDGRLGGTCGNCGAYRFARRSHLDRLPTASLRIEVAPGASSSIDPYPGALAFARAQH